MRGFALENKWCLVTLGVGLIVVKWPIWFHQLWLWREQNYRKKIHSSRDEHMLISHSPFLVILHPKVSLDLQADILAIWTLPSLSDGDERWPGFLCSCSCYPSMWHELPVLSLSREGSSGWRWGRKCAVQLSCLCLKLVTWSPDFGLFKASISLSVKLGNCWVVVVHAFNPSTQEAEAGRSLWVRHQPGLQELVPGQATKLQRNSVLEKSKTNRKLGTCLFAMWSLCKD